MYVYVCMYVCRDIIFGRFRKLVCMNVSMEVGRYVCMYVWMDVCMQCLKTIKQLSPSPIMGGRYPKVTLGTQTSLCNRDPLNNCRSVDGRLAAAGNGGAPRTRRSSAKAEEFCESGGVPEMSISQACCLNMFSS